MKTLKSYVQDGWHEAGRGWVPLVDPCSEETIARASSEGIDFAETLEHSRGRGQSALRGMTLAERGALLATMSKTLQAHRDELIALSLENTGTTRKDAKFDIDGGIFTLAFYAQQAEALGDRPFLLDGEGLQLGRSARFWGQHVLVPLAGVAVHVNAFNFPVWGFAEKAACALLAGMPVITKPATSTALVAQRAVEAVIAGGDLPVLAVTGSASTALKLRVKTNLLESSTRVNVEADSLNAAVLGVDVAADGETWSVFLKDVVREMTQKSGQKCTAVRRILVPRERMDEVQAALHERLTETVVGHPGDASVTMGPLATAQQLDEAVTGVAKLREAAELILGSGERVDGTGNPAGKGFFFGPTLLRAEDARDAAVVHEHEVFGPVATLLPYDGSADDAAEVVALAQGSLVTSLYSDDRAFVGEFLAHGASSSGRMYIGSEKVAGQLPGSGVVLPQLMHGGPGRAGGGVELGGLRGLQLYLQQTALSGDRALIERVTGARAG
ncbi:MAG: aldehyde dehydrogenase family protein [Planctomycetota bacterium]|jgi:oxepin-CoA hydrolase/3-oxo-5,6-dehydrosuberyl-CoA semialdehyde dehydrogenase